MVWRLACAKVGKRTHLLLSCVYWCTWLHLWARWKENLKKKGGKVVKSWYLENTFPTLVPLVTASQASHHPDRNVSLFSSVPLLPGRTASRPSCLPRICQLLSSEQSKTNNDTSISVSKEAEYMLSQKIYDVRPVGFQDDSERAAFVSMSLHANELILYLFTLSDGTCTQTFNLCIPAQLGSQRARSHPVGPNRVFASFPEQAAVVVETLVRDKKDLSTGQENLKSQTLLLPNDLTSKLQIATTAGGLSRISLQFQFWKTKTVPLRGLGEPNNFLYSVSLALNSRELPVFCANIAHSQSWNTGLTLSDSAGYLLLFYGISNRKEFSFLSRKWT